MATITGVIIVKNEEITLAACLDTLSWVDEVVVVDAGSTDNTVNIAKKYTSNVYQESDWQGYGIQRQRAQNYVSSDWILMIDADEHITKELRQSIQDVVQNNDNSKVYALPRLSWVFGRFIKHGGWYPDYVVRLYPKDKANYGNEKVHEKLHFGEEMTVIKLKGDLLHYTYRNLEHYLVKSAGYAAAWAEQRLEKGKRSSLFQGFWHGLACFLRMYIFRLGFLDGKQGLLLAILSAHSTFVKYADLWVKLNDRHQ
ncbi:MAG: glycosyltransferase family 2 protein [Gammaproteobacteria bacterium]|nr:glycosyltransferase family 2 protein [Gammaproteobacteria bacterium]